MPRPTHVLHVTAPIALLLAACSAPMDEAAGPMRRGDRNVANGSGDVATNGSPGTTATQGGTAANGALPDGGSTGVDAGIEPGPATDDGLLPAARRTTWNPGIAGGIPNRTTVCATLSADAFGNGASDAAPAIQSAIDGCPEGQVVVLGPGTFKTSATLRLQKGVVLRGAGSSNGGHPATTLARSPGGTVVQIGRVQSRATADAGTGVDLTADAPKGATTMSVADGSKFKAGDIVHVDAVDDPSVVLNDSPYDCPYFKRAPNRSIGQRVEIKSVSGNTLTLESPLHWSFTKALGAQVAPITVPITRGAGLEGVRIVGGDHPYDGGGVDVWNAAYSWVKDVETDTITGMHIVLSGTYRFVVRDSYVHHSGNYGYGTGCYGIVIRFQSADALVENNIARYVNKPILFNASGGGNVVAYNYADDSWATPGWQELNIDCHCNFPHMELIEGNYAPHIGMTSTHGNAGYLTFFRNYASSQFLERTGLTGNVAAIQLDTRAVGMNVVGNVLGTAGIGAAYEASAGGAQCDKPHVFLLGSGYDAQTCNWSSAADPALTTLFRHGNFDFVGNTTVWDASESSHALANSLYLGGRPAFWPATLPWPWVGPDRTPTVGTLPAKARFDAMPP